MNKCYKWVASILLMFLLMIIFVSCGSTNPSNNVGYYRISFTHSGEMTDYKYYNHLEKIKIISNTFKSGIEYEYGKEKVTIYGGSTILIPEDIDVIDLSKDEYDKNSSGVLISSYDGTPIFFINNHNVEHYIDRESTNNKSGIIKISDKTIYVYNLCVEVIE